MPSIDSKPLNNFVQRMLEAANIPTQDAHLVSESLVNTNLAGHDSHGVIRVTQYLESIEKGLINTHAKLSFRQASASIAVVDGDFGLGQVVAKYGIDLAIENAQKLGLAATGLTNCGHVGRLGEWVSLAAEANMIGLAFCNGGSPGGLVAPYGSAKRFMGTNPFAAAVPVKEHPPIVLDFATSVMAEGKVRVARNKGTSLPEGVVQTKEGLASTNPNDLYDGGALLAMGAHKGSGLAFLMELVGGLLLNQGSPSLPNYGQFHNGVLFIVLSIEAFRPLEPFLADVLELNELFKTIPTAPGFDGVFLPGELESLTAQERRKTGIPIDGTTWSQLCDWAHKLRVAIPKLAS